MSSWRRGDLYLPSHPSRQNKHNGPEPSPLLSSPRQKRSKGVRAKRHYLPPKRKQNIPINVMRIIVPGYRLRGRICVMPRGHRGCLAKTGTIPSIPFHSISLKNKQHCGRAISFLLRPIFPANHFPPQHPYKTSAPNQKHCIVYHTGDNPVLAVQNHGTAATRQHYYFFFKCSREFLVPGTNKALSKDCFTRLPGIKR